MFKRVLALAFLLALLFMPGSAGAQAYYYNVKALDANAFWNEDGTLSIDYVFTFANDPSAGYIEYLDLGMPNPNFDVNSISADVDGTPITDISESGYQGDGSGVAIGLGNKRIPPGETGQMHVFIGKVGRVLNPDTSDQKNYASGDFAPAQFDSRNAYGTTDMVVTFHLPPGVLPEEPRWHEAPAGWPATPETGLDENGLITYTWRNSQANISNVYNFGASFPSKYIPASAIVRPNSFAWIGNLFSAIGGCIVPFLCISFFVAIIAASIYGNRHRKLQYLPPKISIEGHGIKRGLTAVEAAILMEQPMEKIMTMILFGTIKKNTAQVVTRDPLKLEVTKPIPEDLQPYEKEFLEAFLQEDNKARQKALQEMMINLVKSVSQKMKGFSRRETIAFYKDIMQRAWAQVEAADTPEVKSQKFDEYMDWTMLDRDFDNRTRDVFRTGPVFVPVWWGRYDPGFGGATPVHGPTPTISRPSTGGAPSLPTLPGGTFAASVAGGIQNFSSKVVGNITDFTSSVTQKTNPPPPPSTSGRSGGGFSGGGHSCACACACAGCACACAGGSR